MGNELSSLFQHQGSIEILSVVLPLLNKSEVAGFVETAFRFR